MKVFLDVPSTSSGSGIRHEGSIVGGINVCLRGTADDGLEVGWRVVAPVSSVTKVK